MEACVAQNVNVARWEP